MKKPLTPKEVREAMERGQRKLDRRIEKAKEEGAGERWLKKIREEEQTETNRPKK